MPRPRALVGTSGWVYRHWRGVLYPEGLPQRAWLAHYAEQFPTVEINATFYRLPKPETVQRWRETVPPGFVFAVKASRQITHLKRLEACGDELKAFLDAARALGDRLGPILFQLPPNFAADADRLDAFARLLPTDLLAVMEFREASWFSDDIRALLEARGLVFCIHDHRGRHTPGWVTGPAAYYRFHGLQRTPDGHYSDAALKRVAAQMREIMAEGRDVYAYFNNDAYGCAVRDAAKLAALLGAREAA